MAIAQRAERICADRLHWYERLTISERYSMFPEGVECSIAAPIEPFTWRMEYQVRRLHWERVAMLTEWR